MKNIEPVLQKVYDNEELRRKIVPLFIGNPGMGKTQIIAKFAKERGVKLVELITSQMNPFEISGIAMPDKELKKMTYYNFDKLETLEDGDILFFDELLNGNPIVLNACLTILEQRTLISGKKLPNIMIIAAANPQGMVPITPQIKERFLWYDVKFDANMWKKYMKDKYNMPYIISQELCRLIENEEFINNNFYTPRSIDKAVSMLSLNCITPYEEVIGKILSYDIRNNLGSSEILKINDDFKLNSGDSVNWKDILMKSDPKESIMKACDISDPTSEEEKYVYSVFLTGIGNRKKGVNADFISSYLNISNASASNIAGDLIDGKIKKFKLCINIYNSDKNDLITSLDTLDATYKIEKELIATHRNYDIYLNSVKSNTELDIVDYLTTFLNLEHEEAVKLVESRPSKIVSNISHEYSKYISQELENLRAGIYMEIAEDKKSTSEVEEKK